MTLAQIIAALTSPLAILIATAIAGTVVSPWLKAHQQQVDATTASIQDAQTRTKAQEIVRALETNPAHAQLPGATQRAAGISLLSSTLGISPEEAAVGIDAAYNLLTALGQLVKAPKPAALPATDSTMSAALARIEAKLAPPMPTPLQPIPAPPPTPPTTLDAERQKEEVLQDIAQSSADFGVLAQEATAAPGGAAEPVPAVLPGAGG